MAGASRRATCVDPRPFVSAGLLGLLGLRDTRSWSGLALRPQGTACRTGSRRQPLVEAGKPIRFAVGEQGVTVDVESGLDRGVAQSYLDHGEVQPALIR
jgi:hypothetical protein